MLSNIQIKIKRTNHRLGQNYVRLFNACGLPQTCRIQSIAHVFISIKT